MINPPPYRAQLHMPEWAKAIILVIILMAVGCMTPIANAGAGPRMTYPTSLTATRVMQADARLGLERILTTNAGDGPFGRNSVLWDTESSKHIVMAREHGTDIRPCTPTLVGGVDAMGKGLRVYEKCTFINTNFDRPLLTEHAVANILSQGLAKDQGFRVNYDDPRDPFTVQHKSGGQVYKFGRQVGVNGVKTKHYAMDIETHLPLEDIPFSMVGSDGPTTVAGQKAKYTARQVADANAALRFMDVMGGPALGGAIQMVNSMRHPPCTEYDIKRAIDIYGPMQRTVKGSTTKARSAEASKEVPDAHEPEPQILELDIAFIKGRMFLIGLFCPLDLCMVRPLLGGKGANELVEQIEHMRQGGMSRGYPVSEIRCDNEAGIRDGDTVRYLQSKGIPIEFVGAGAHCPRVERRIRWLKEKFRGIEHSLPYTMNNFLIGWGVIASARFTNLQRTTSSTTDLSPRDKFLRRRFDYKIDGRISFGEYLQVTAADTDNTSKARTEGCIALMPRDNHTGSFYAYHLATSKLIVRDNFQRIPIPQALTDLLNKSAKAQGHSRGTSPLPTPEFGHDGELASGDEGGGEAVVDRGDRSDANQNAENRGDDNDEPPEVEMRGATRHSTRSEIAASRESAVMRGVEVANTEPAQATYWTEDMLITTNLRSSPTEHVLAIRDGIEFEDDPCELGLLKRFKKTVDEDKHSTAYSFTISVKKAMSEYGESGCATITKEMQQMLDKQVFHPVRAANLSPAQQKKIIPCKLFVKEKNDAQGVFDKLKGRLVAGGHRQDKTLYDNLNSPTADHASLMTIIAIAASEQRYVATCDIGGAYLNAPMPTTGIKVHMRIDRTLAGILCKLDAVYSRFLDTKGELVVQLDKALYGCVESASLWYAQLSTFLVTELGFRANIHDACVFNKTNSAGQQVTIILHVDDMLLTCECEQTIARVLGAIDERYPDTTMHAGPKVDFLGMALDFSSAGECEITMNGMVQDIVDKSDIEGYASSPATESLFEIDASKEPIADDVTIPGSNITVQDWFHTFTAKILYLAKRVKPECLTTVAYLATRVKKADEDDVGKLRRLIRYLRSSSGRGLRLRPGLGGIKVRAYIDAAYGVHIDGKSLSGAAIFVGDNAVVHVKSGKQSIVTKSSTESEVVATSDNMNQAFYVRNFIVAQGHKSEPVEVLQDNLSCIALLERGKSTSMRTRHIQIRYFWISERLDGVEARVTHLGTELMGPANILTKPLQGEQFRIERQALTNWDQPEVAAM